MTVAHRGERTARPVARLYLRLVYHPETAEMSLLRTKESPRGQIPPAANRLLGCTTSLPQALNIYILCMNPSMLPRISELERKPPLWARVVEIRVGHP